jgi:hypothetical protein
MAARLGDPGGRRPVAGIAASIPALRASVCQGRQMTRIHGYRPADASEVYGSAPGFRTPSPPQPRHSQIFLPHR